MEPFDDDDYTDVLGTLPADLPQFPHCDMLILHSPGACVYCDGHTDWQVLRSAQGIAFSDMPDDLVAKHNLIPCPSTYHRPADVRDRWGGNRPTQRVIPPDRLPAPVAQTLLGRVLARFKI